MIRQSIILIMLLGVSSSLHAEKLYKIVDDEGNVSFSQFPPVEKEEDATIEGISVSGGPQSVVTEGVNGRYCGKIRLPRPSSSSIASASYLTNLEKQRSSWQDSLDRLNRSVDATNQSALQSNKYRSKYNQGYQSAQSKRYQETIAKNSEKLRDLRCALDWADEELDGNHDLIAKNRNERERLAQIKEQLEAQLQADCGELPAYDPTDRRNDFDRKSWYDCSKKLRREISTVQREINKG